MSQRTLYSCDMCGTESKDKDFIVRVGTKYMPIPVAWSTDTHKCVDTYEDFDVCFDCALHKLHQVKMEPIAKPEPIAPPNPYADLDAKPTITEAQF